MSPVFIYVTCANSDEAERIGRALVDARLAACANILPGMSSIYRWQEQIETAQETVLIMKSTAENFEPLTARVRAMHSYMTPCIVALPIVAGSPDFLAWLEENTRPESTRLA
ncbi:MAG: divalent-cation tolerance protein CutA [Alphaproteobacteria bacterium]